MRRFLILAKTELRLSLRSPDAVIFAILMPVIIMVVIVLIFGDDPVPATGLPILESTFGAFLSIGIAAIGLMGLPLVLAEYRDRKVLKRLQVTPVHPGMLLSVQFFVQSIMAILSGCIVLAVAVVAFSYAVTGSLMSVIGAYLLSMLSIFSIGMVIASVAKDVKQAGILCSIAYFPMLLFSGTTIPLHVFPRSIQSVTAILPLRHGIELLNGMLTGRPAHEFLLQWVILTGIAAICITVSVVSFTWDME